MNYYLKPNRPADVIKFIQFTGLRPTFQSTDDAFHKELVAPRSSPRWIDLFEEHPEFFRVMGTADQRGQRSISLLARYYRSDDSHAPRDPMPFDQVKSLIDLSVSLHERHVRNRENRKAILAFSGAVFTSLIAGIFAILAKK